MMRSIYSELEHHNAFEPDTLDTQYRIVKIDADSANVECMRAQIK